MENCKYLVEALQAAGELALGEVHNLAAVVLVLAPVAEMRPL